MNKLLIGYSIAVALWFVTPFITAKMYPETEDNDKSLISLMLLPGVLFFIGYFVLIFGGF